MAGTGPLRWGIVGTGHMADGMASAIAAVEGNRIDAVAGRQPEAAAEFAGRHRAARAAPSALDLCADPDLDVVYVGSPNALHEEHAIAALRGGKHVLCDKPIALDVDGARAVLAAAVESGRRVSLNLQMRHHPAAVEVRDLIRSGGIGPVMLVRGAIGFGPEELVGWRADPALAGAAALHNLGVHLFDTVRFLVGTPIESVAAFRRPDDGPDRTVVSVVRFAGGALGYAQVSQELPVDDVAIEIVGRDGRITWEGWMAPYRSGPLTIDRTGQPSVGRTVSCRDAYTRLVAGFVDAIRSGREPDPSAADVLASATIIAAILESAPSGRAVAV